MIEHRLSPAILAKATLAGNEYAWRAEDVEAAIEDARRRGLANCGGQAQFRLPNATCELYWVDIQPELQRPGESWDDYVSRSAADTISLFRTRLAETDWAKEIENWALLRKQAASGVDVMGHRCFVLYFEGESA